MIDWREIAICVAFCFPMCEGLHRLVQDLPSWIVFLICAGFIVTGFILIKRYGNRRNKG